MVKATLLLNNISFTHRGAVFSVSRSFYERRRGNEPMGMWNLIEPLLPCLSSLRFFLNEMNGYPTGYTTGQFRTRTADCGLGIKYGLGIRRGLWTADWV